MQCVFNMPVSVSSLLEKKKNRQLSRFWNILKTITHPPTLYSHTLTNQNPFLDNISCCLVWAEAFHQLIARERFCLKGRLWHRSFISTLHQLTFQGKNTVCLLQQELHFNQPTMKIHNSLTKMQLGWGKKKITYHFNELFIYNRFSVVRLLIKQTSEDRISASYQGQCWETENWELFIKLTEKFIYKAYFT